MITIKRYSYIDALNVVSAFAVVMIHTNGPVFWENPNGMLWFTSTFIEIFFNFAVPIFFMIIGVTSLTYHKKYTTRQFLIRRFLRVLPPFIFWSIFAFFYKMYILKSINEEFNFINFLLGIYNHTYMEVFWFFIPLFSIYISLPVLAILITNLKVTIYITIYSFISYFVIPFIIKLYDINFDISILSPIAINYLVYVLSGYIFNCIEISKVKRIFIYTLGIAAFLCDFITTLISDGPADPNNLYRGHINWSVYLQTLAIFIFVKYINWDKFGPNFAKIFTKLQGCCFGIYCIHIFFIWQYIHLGYDYNSLCFRTIGSIMIFFICFIIVYFARKIQYLRILFG